MIAARLGTLEACTISLDGDNPSLTLADAQQQRLLERLREAGDEAVAFAELHAPGIAFPAAVVSELELNEYVIERVYEHGRLIGARLLQPEPPATPGLSVAAAASMPKDRASRDRVWCVLRPLDAAKGPPVHHHGSRGAVRAAMVAPAIPRP